MLVARFAPKRPGDGIEVVGIDGHGGASGGIRRARYRHVLGSNARKLFRKVAEAGLETITAIIVPVEQI